MALRAKKPEAVIKRLKLFMFGPAGTGKTTAVCQMPAPYIIDTEKGSENYDKLITKAGGVVFQTTDMGDVVSEVKALLNERHEYRTLVIDPITAVYQDLLLKAETKVGTDHGRHYGEADKQMRRLVNLIMKLDMNVCITSHAKVEYGENFKKLGYTFDAWKRLDYMFDLVIELGKQGKKRMGTVRKTRVAGFPDGESFEWRYDEIKRRYGDVGTLEREAVAQLCATPDQVAEIAGLLELVKLPDDTVDKWFNKAGVDTWEDMPAETIGKCIQFIRDRLNPAAKGAA